MSCNYFTKLIQYALDNNLKNDQFKKIIPENLLITLIFTINIRSLRNFLKLRTSKGAHEDMQILANKIHGTIPESHKFLYEDVLNNE